MQIRIIFILEKSLQLIFLKIIEQGDINCGLSSHPDFIKNYFLSISPFPPILDGKMEQLMSPCLIIIWIRRSYAQRAGFLGSQLLSVVLQIHGIAFAALTDDPKYLLSITAVVLQQSSFLNFQVTLPKIWSASKGLVPFIQLVKLRRVTWFWHFPASHFHETFTRSSLALNMSRKLILGP